MGSGILFADLIRLSSELVRESQEANQRVRERISQSNTIIDLSRQLLSMWPVDGGPALVETGRAVDSPCASREGSLVRRVDPASRRHTSELERVSERNFSNESVSLDGTHFVDCVIENCVLEYCGGPLVLEGTSFSGCQFRFGGEAAMTVSMLGCFGLIREQDLASGAPTPAATRVN